MASSKALRAARTVLVALMGALLVLYGAPALGAAPSVGASPSAEEKEQLNSVTITSDKQFDREHGVRSGSGTAADPYVISDWRVSSIRIADTGAHVLIEDNLISSQLVLNWNGPGITVVNNTIGDLRVNQNVKRTGDATGGLIAHNTFGTVGQLRHFDGIFENNLVGISDEMDLPLFDQQAVQFDGFHGSRFRNNKIYGYVDVKLHGHHHGSSFSEGSHYHGNSKENHDDMDHTVRYHEVFITGNTIEAVGNYALRYYDQAHQGDDRTATSETNKELEMPHIHYTRVHMNSNKLIGSGMMVDVFNAQDERHKGLGMGLMEIKNNTIELERGSNDLFELKDGIAIRDARGLTVKIVGNRISRSYEAGDPVPPVENGDAGIRLEYLDQATVFVKDNSVADMAYGINAFQFTDSVSWYVTDFTTSGVGQRMSRDRTVPEPNGDQGPGTGHEDHDH